MEMAGDDDVQMIDAQTEKRYLQSRSCPVRHLFSLCVLSHPSNPFLYLSSPRISYRVKAIIRKKVLFASRPKPLISKKL